MGSRILDKHFQFLEEIREAYKKGAPSRLTMTSVAGLSLHHQEMVNRELESGEHVKWAETNASGLPTLQLNWLIQAGDGRSNIATPVGDVTFRAAERSDGKINRKKLPLTSRCDQLGAPASFGVGIRGI